MDGFEITVEVDGETRRYRNHSPGRLSVVRDQQTPVVVQEAWRLIRATGPRGHQACIALDDDDFEPCRRSTLELEDLTSVLADTPPQEVREHLALAKIEEAIGAFERWVHLSLEHLAEMTGDDLDARRSEADAYARAKAEDHVRRWLEREAGPSSA